MKLSVVCFVLILCSALGQSPAESEYYMAAVVEYASFFNESQSPAENIRKNVEEYIVNIRIAKARTADIIVFPECGLTTINLPANIPDLQQYTTLIPDVDEHAVLCDDDIYSDTLHQLSCAAKQYNIYVVVNLPERSVIDTNDVNGDKFLIFNTNIVFDRKGAIIAKYRKFNLFVEPGFNTTKTPDITTFETDFGVTFGTFICFDILFAKPALEILKLNPKVTDIVYPTAWFSELPFLTAVQTQAGWARSTGVNLLAAGYSDPRKMNGGSGVFQATGDIQYTVPVTKLTTLIVQRVQKLKRRVIPNTVDPSTAIVTNVNDKARIVGKLETMKEDMRNYTTVLINDTNVKDQKICHGKFCCSFSVVLEPSDSFDYRYRIVVYDGLRIFVTIPGNVQICGVIACTDETLNSCGEHADHSGFPRVFKHISIKGDFKNDDNTVVFPSNTLYDLSVLLPSAFEYSDVGACSKKTVEMKTNQEVSRLLGFGIYGITISSTAGSFALMPLVVITLITVIAINKYYF